MNVSSPTVHRVQKLLTAAYTYDYEPYYKPHKDNIPCSFDGSFHYSWDYAQQVHIPHYSQEVGPVYFKTPRKCNVFGMCCEGSGKQVFYLVDESDSFGKGADSIVSMVHHYLYWYGHGEIDGKFHFDNAAGQNKNNIVLWYGLWRVLLGDYQIQNKSQQATSAVWSADNKSVV
ncbi:uncharacterized protein LOC123560143 [Mercenaria mercenaria]|uniref:uncharacterized protein LOC123560143 n=1 Tax=Mercenaria mercenaria TaxID=6596 RepID=UPI00234FA5B2|nr:uncharacterized protein LOC123560143 [Mercenaria mercenaria]XP_053402545.1 uncharacterized protein LOC123560143 [Mercenaria mercenaria]XP_053402546.1 uncharacterized protein LOC123560143 [Mercenaria mercenaria]XP_053402547.1 uncharacterized protein LOC123560143 [Mercenaria mercenaria]XP_053402548.1 uncharacterized protein LOC123560143 [Mercenaria mercenaria]XP_053402549.1 uncharacterized protein LOC123560143 [Mercenaria mercenaria]XP_053402550.1 uncharacterized protein LOC123560143 [Mercen